MSETPSHFVAVCPNCLQTLRINSSYSGNHVRCKHCDHKFRALAPDDLTMTPTSAEYPPAPLTPSRPAADRMTVICPGCSASLSVRRALAGQHVRCKNCDHKFLVEKIVELPVSPSAGKAEKDLFDHLYSTIEPAEAPGPMIPAATGELAAVRDQCNQLQGELATLQDQHSRLQIERDAMAEQLEQLRGEHAELQSHQRNDQEERARLGAELASIRQSLGDLPPGEIAAIRNERDALRSEIDQLRSQAELASTEASRQADLSEVVALRDQELLQAQHQVEALTRQIQDLHDAVNDSRAASDQLEQRVRELEEELAKSRVQHEELNSRLRTAETETEDRARQLHGGLAERDDEINRVREQLASTTSERNVLQARVNELLHAQEALNSDRNLVVSRHEQELREAREQVNQLTQQVQNLDVALNGSHAHRDQLEHRVRELEEELARAHSDREEATGRLFDHTDELSARDAEIARLLALQKETEGKAVQLRDGLAERNQELREARQQIEQITQQVQNLDVALNGSHAHRDQLEHRVRELEEELARAHSDREEATGRLRTHSDELSAKGDEIARLLAFQAETEDQSKQLHGELAQREQELREARQQIEQITQQVQNLDVALNAAHSQRDQLEHRVRELEEELARAHSEHEQVTGRLREHSDELSAKGDEISRLLALHTENEARAKHLQDGLTQRDDEINRVREQLASATSARDELQARVDELVDAQEKAKAGYPDAIEAERARLRTEFESLAEAERSRHAEQLADVQARASENAQLVERLRAEILALAESRSGPDADLEAARQEIADLRRRLYEKETSQQSMSSLLEGMGIRLH